LRELKVIREEVPFHQTVVLAVEELVVPGLVLLVVQVETAETDIHGHLQAQLMAVVVVEVLKVALKVLAAPVAVAMVAVLFLGRLQLRALTVLAVAAVAGPTLRVLLGQVDLAQLY
jgi:hypothetical protein